VPLYQFYALLFADAGLSQGQISALFALWSLTSVLSEVPTGVLADRWSRRGSVVLASVLQAGGFALWTALPVAPAFAAGFVLWGIGGSLSSGAAEALVFEGLSAAGGRSVYARLTGWMSATELMAQVPTAVLATLLFSAGGYPLVGWVSVAACLATAVLAGRFPEPARVTEPEPDEDAGSYLATLRAGLGEAVRRPGLAAVVAAAALVLSLDGIEEYFTLMAEGWGVPTALVPLAVLAVPLAGAAGAALGGRAATLPGGTVLALFVLAGASLGAAAFWARPPALAAVALFYGLYRTVLVVTEARLQHRIDGPHRATITSVAGLGSELATLLVYAAWTVGSTGALAVLAAAVVPVLALGLRAGDAGRRAGGGACRGG
jgi:MFS family permease